jgi:hypothetical protein
MNNIQEVGTNELVGVVGGIFKIGSFELGEPEVMKGVCGAGAMRDYKNLFPNEPPPKPGEVPNAAKYAVAICNGGTSLGGGDK